MASERRGIALGVAAYAMWGLFPIYWALLEPGGALELLAHRIVWSLAFVVVVLAVARRGFRNLPRDRRALSLLGIASVLIGVNWMKNYGIVVTDRRVFLVRLVGKLGWTASMEDAQPRARVRTRPLASRSPNNRPVDRSTTTPSARRFAANSPAISAAPTEICSFHRKWFSVGMMSRPVLKVPLKSAVE